MSAWGLAFGLAWGNAWGQVQDTSGGGIAGNHAHPAHWAWADGNALYVVEDELIEDAVKRELVKPKPERPKVRFAASTLLFPPMPALDTEQAIQRYKQEAKAHMLAHRLKVMQDEQDAVMAIVAAMLAQKSDIVVV